MSEIIPYSMSEGKITSLRAGEEIIELPPTSFDKFDEIKPTVQEFISAKKEYETFKSAFEVSEEKFNSAKEKFDQILSQPSSQKKPIKPPKKEVPTPERIITPPEPEPIPEPESKEPEPTIDEIKKEFDNNLVNPPEPEKPIIVPPPTPTDPKEIAALIIDPLVSSLKSQLDENPSTELDDAMIESEVRTQCNIVHVDISSSRKFKSIVKEVLNGLKQKGIIEDKKKPNPISKFFGRE